MTLFTPGLFFVAFLVVSVVAIGVQFVPEDGPDPLPLTLRLFPVMGVLFTASIVTI